ncbi:MAG: HIT domain-containing protein [Candidatus Woesearchaeota archaeon]
MEGQQPTQEELKNMSPEQIAEMQKQNCIFCHIISGKVASKKVFEDDKCTAVLDINPANPGHVLLMPNEHYAIMPLIPDDVMGHLFMVTKGISHACLKAFKAQGTNIFIANGVAAGQKAQHFMIHVIPRKDDDGLTNFELPKKNMTGEQKDQLMKALKPQINAAFGMKEEAKGEAGSEAQPLEAAEGGVQAEETGSREETQDSQRDEEDKAGTQTKREDEGEKEPESGEKGDESDEGRKSGEDSREQDEDKNEGNDEVDLDRIADLFGGGGG